MKKIEILQHLILENEGHSGPCSDAYGKSLCARCLAKDYVKRNELLYEKKAKRRKK